MEVQSIRLRDAATAGAMDICLHARNNGGAVTFVPSNAKVTVKHMSGTAD